jgi:transposase InsO family protein
LHHKAGKKAATAFLRNLIAAVPYRLHIVLTPSQRLQTNACRAMDDGIQFTNHDRHIYAFEHIFDRVCREHQIEHRLTKIKHPWTNGQIERIPLTVCRQTVAGQRNRTIKDATVKRFHYDDHDQLRNHMANFISAYNFGRKLKTLKGLTPYEFICKCWTSQPERFTLNLIHQMPGLNT